MPRKKKSPKVDSQRETRVLLENMYSDIKKVAEGHSELVSRLDEIDNKLLKNESDHFKLEMKVESIKSQTGTIDSKVDRIERQVNSIKDAVMEVGAVTKDHETRLKKLEVV